MKPDTDKELVYSKSVIEFLTVAHEFCVFTEKTETFSQDDVLNYYQKILPLMYVKGSLLPAVANHDDIIAERFVTEEQWENVFQILHEKFAEGDSYPSIHKNDYNEWVPVTASIADNLSDVYQDMKDFVMLYQKGTQHAKENALNECRKLFSRRWGIRAIKAQMAIHRLLFSEKNINDEE